MLRLDCYNLSIDIALNVWFTTNGMCVKNNTHMYVPQTSNNTVIAAHDLYCCLLAQCEVLHICRSGFPIATKWCCDQDVKIVPSTTFAKRTCDRCSSLWKRGDVVATSPLALRWMCDSSWMRFVWRTTPICGASKQ